MRNAASPSRIAGTITGGSLRIKCAHRIVTAQEERRLWWGNTEMRDQR